MWYILAYFFKKMSKKLVLNHGQRADQRIDAGQHLMADSAVQVRFGYLTREENLTSEKIDEELITRAYAESVASSLNDLIKQLVKEYAYKVARLGLAEFLERFKKNNLADVIVGSFVRSIAEMDNDPQKLAKFGNFSRGLGPEEMKKAKNYLIQTIWNNLENKNLSGAVTLYELLKDLQDRFPYVRLGEVFTTAFAEESVDGVQRQTNLSETVVDKINDNVGRIATEAYMERFNEDKKGFVMRFMMGRVISFDKEGKEMIFDKKKFRDLMSYLDGLGVDIESIDGVGLYEWLAEESGEMAKHVEAERLNITRKGIREDLGKLPIGVEEKSKNHQAKLFFEKGFDVEAFFSKHIAPAIYRYNSSKVKKNYSNPEVSLFHGVNSPEKMSQVIFSTGHLAFLKLLVDTAKADPEKRADFMATIRSLFGFDNSPFLKSFSNAEVQELLAYYMDIAEQKINKNLKDAMHYLKDSENSADKEVIEASKYFPEITGCRDLAKLMEWLVYKDAFKKDFPDYAKVPNKIIHHQCLMMLKDFGFVSKRISTEEFARVVERRDVLEGYQVDKLQIRNTRNVIVRYRLMEELGEDGNCKKSDDRYKVVYDGTKLEGFDMAQDKDLARRLMAAPDQHIIEYQGKKYFVHSIEEAKFRRVKMRVKNMQKSPTTKLLVKVVRLMEVLIYAGRNQYIHVKDELTRLLSETRGKEVSDENRWLIVPANKKDSEFLKSSLLRDHAREIIKVDDKQAGVTITTKKTPKIPRTESSELFKNNQSWTVAKKYSWPDKKRGTAHKAKFDPRDMIRYDAVLETQSQNLEDLLIYNISDYAPSSHTVYRVERAWKLLNIYFNPQVWGDKYRKYFKRGHKGDKKL